jgi:hypothetical protein
MKKFSFKLYIAILVIMPFSGVFSHVALDYPAGGETFTAGQTVNIQWHVVIPHSQDNWDLYFSADGGSSWEAIQLDLPVNQLNYQWTVPQRTTQTGRIKIYMDNSGTDYEDSSGNFTIEGSATGVNSSNSLVSKFELYQNYPNPFNPNTTIEYWLDKPSQVLLKIFNPLGQEIVTLTDEFQTEGQHLIEWNGRNKGGQIVPSGVYIYQLKSDGRVKIHKMMLIR